MQMQSACAPNASAVFSEIDKLVQTLAPGAPCTSSTVVWMTTSSPPGVASAQGREHEWMFASEEGRAQVAASCRSRRTILISMRRGQQYGDLDALKVGRPSPA